MRLVRRAFFAVLVIAPLLCSAASAEGPGGGRPGGGAGSSVARARQLLVQLDESKREILALLKSGEGLTGEDLDLKRVEAMAIVGDANVLMGDLVGVLAGLDPAVAAHDSILSAAESHLRFQAELTLEAIERVHAGLVELQHLRGSTPPDGLGRLESRIGEDEGNLNKWAARVVDIGRMMEEIGFDASGIWDRIDRFETEHAEQLGNQLQLALLERRRAREQIEAARRIGIDVQQEQLLRFQAAEMRVEATVSSMTSAADLLDARGFDSSEYRLLVIRATGRVTEDVLNWKVLLGLAGGALHDILGWLRDRGPTALVRFGIVILFALVFRVIGWLAWQLVRFFLRLPKLMADLLGRLVRPASTIVGIAVGLWFLGVNPTTLLAGLGVAGIIVGLALQDSLSNLAAGLFILLYKPYDVDEIVQAGGVLGRVKRMGLANTTIITFDNRRFFVPNRKIWGDIIENRSLEKIRRVQATVRVSYDDDVVKVLRYIGETLKESDLVLDEPAPAIFVSKLDDSWLEVSVWPWTRTENWWALETQLPLILQVGLSKRGVAVPYPRRRIDISRETPPGSDTGA